MPILRRLAIDDVEAIQLNVDIEETIDRNTTPAVETWRRVGSDSISWQRTGRESIEFPYRGRIWYTGDRVMAKQSAMADKISLSDMVGYRVAYQDLFGTVHQTFLATRLDIIDEKAVTTEDKTYYMEFTLTLRRVGQLKGVGEEAEDGSDA